MIYVDYFWKATVNPMVIPSKLMMIKPDYLMFYNQDLQLQTEHSDGRCSIEEIVAASITNGRKIIGITDHAIGWNDGDEHCRFFMSDASFIKYLNEIKAAHDKYAAQGVSVLKGLEVEINLDGTMALADGIVDVIGSEDRIRDYVDYVIGVIHSESFTVSLAAMPKIRDQSHAEDLLMQNIAALIANPQVLIWGHPFQVVHGHYKRHYTESEQKFILKCLKQRIDPLLIEYNLNPTPRYMEWDGKSTYYENGQLTPNDINFLRRCAEQGSEFVISTDAHDQVQTGRLNSKIVVPDFILSRLHYIT
jgi:histidinol phosphatase-like PHP family hydrolase